MYFSLVDKFWHAIAILRIVFYKVVTGGRINISTQAVFRRGFNILTRGGAN